MAKIKDAGKYLLIILCIGVLVLDAKAVADGVRDGIALCMGSVIPALFPFLVLTKLLTASITGKTIPILYPIGKLCGIPNGCEFLFLVGLLSGYPVGAQAVTQVYQNKQITRKTAERLLGFCSNAGPAFIFGLLPALFTAPHIVYFIWLTHIISALLVGALLSDKSTSNATSSKPGNLTLTTAVEESVKAMATTCAWIIIFRVLINIFTSAASQLFPLLLRTIAIGCLELTNGCCELSRIDQENIRFILVCAFLSFGGFCVLMQTKSVTAGVGLGKYLYGKILQTDISILIASVLSRVLFPDSKPIPAVIPAMLIAFILTAVILQRKNNSSIMKKSVV